MNQASFRTYRTHKDAGVITSRSSQDRRFNGWRSLNFQAAKSGLGNSRSSHLQVRIHIPLYCISFLITSQVKSSLNRNNIRKPIECAPEASRGASRLERAARGPSPTSFGVLGLTRARQSFLWPDKSGWRGGGKAIEDVLSECAPHPAHAPRTISQFSRMCVRARHRCLQP